MSFILKSNIEHLLCDRCIISSMLLDSMLPEGKGHSIVTSVFHLGPGRILKSTVTPIRKQIPLVLKLIQL